MVTLTSLRTILAEKVFNNTVGTDVTITPVTKGISTDGGFTPSTDGEGTPVTLKGIPYSNSTAQYFTELFGNVEDAEGTCILPYDTTINIDDKIEWLGTTYRVKDKEDFIYGNGVAAIQIRCNEEL